MDTQTVKEWFATLARPEQTELLQDLRRLVPAAPQKALGPMGFAVRKKSSKDCSGWQRLFLLGTGASKLAKLETPVAWDGYSFDQAATNKYGGIVLSRSDTLMCPAKGTLSVDAQKVIAAVPNYGWHSQGWSMQLGNLSKHISMRNKEKFSRIYLDEDTGQLLMGAPYYPNTQSTNCWLDAQPWQRLLYTLKVGGNSRTVHFRANGTKYLGIVDAFHLAIIPIEVNHAENQETQTGPSGQA